VGRFLKSLVITLMAELLLLTLSACTPPQNNTPQPTDQPRDTPTVTPSPPASPTPGQPTPTAAIPTPFGGGNGRILFSSYRFGESEIFILPVSGNSAIKEGETTRLTELTGRANQPVWSPDGKWIAFAQRLENENVEIYVMPLPNPGEIISDDHPQLLRLTNNRHIDSEPAWSPDGSKIAFSSNRSLSFHIYTINPDGSGLTQLTNNITASAYRSWNTSPRWSPDGTKITFRATRRGNNEIYVMNADGSSQVNLSNHSASDVDPCWSPDGKQIAFVSDRDGLEEIYIMDVNGVNQTRLTFNDDKDTFPVWSPDGQWIAFYSRRDGNYEIYIMRPDGSEQTRLTDHYNFDGFPAWEPPKSDTTLVRFENQLNGNPGSSPAFVQALSWLKNNTIPITVGETTGNSSGLESFSQLVGETRIVELSDPALATHESFTIRQHILLHLVESQAFDTIIFEIDWANGVRLNRYLQTGEGDPTKMVKDFVDPRWHTQEAVELIESLREHNLNPGGAPTINVYGSLVGNPSLAMDLVIEYLQQVKPEHVPQAERWFACFRDFEADWNSYALDLHGICRECRDSLQLVYDLLGSNAEEYISRSSTEAYNTALQAARIVQQGEESYWTYISGYGDLTETLKWIISEAGPGAKLILWSYHTDVRTRSGFPAEIIYQSRISSRLSQLLDQDPYTLGFTFGQGDIQMISTQSIELKTLLQSIPLVTTESFEWYAHNTGLPAFILPLGQVSADLPETAWLSGAIAMRLISYQPTLGRTENTFVEVVIPSIFDALIYVDQVSPPTPLD
jgi:Tol biopolymer transport system component/erythromycin esterase-like protein